MIDGFRLSTCGVCRRLRFCAKFTPTGHPHGWRCRVCVMRQAPIAAWPWRRRAFVQNLFNTALAVAPDLEAQQIELRWRLIEVEKLVEGRPTCNTP
jgi:hypothetical protein